MRVKKNKSLTQWKILGISIVFLVVSGVFYGINCSTVNVNMDKQFLEAVNQLRLARGAKALTVDERIAEVARIHSENMAEGLTPFGHVDSYLRFDKINSSGVEWLAIAENVANVSRSGNPIKDAIDWWKAMMVYKENMEGDFDLTGIGIAQNKSTGEYFITEIFVKNK